MNERMLALYRQAKVPHTAIDPSNNMPYETTIFSANKFAQLIIAECADVAWRNTPETEELEYSHLISDKIKQHFRGE